MENIVNFNLKTDGQVAYIRVLHSSVATFQHVFSHWVGPTNRPKRTTLRCSKTNCLLCGATSSGAYYLPGQPNPLIDQKIETVYLKVFDYTDNTVKVWGLNPAKKTQQKVIDRISAIATEWSAAVNTLVFKVTCNAKTLQTERGVITYYEYTLDNAAPSGYPMPEEQSDEQFGIRMCTSRTPEQYKSFIDTGVLPDKIKKEFVPKDQYNAAQFMNQVEAQPGYSAQPAYGQPTYNPAPQAQPTYPSTPAPQPTYAPQPTHAPQQYAQPAPAPQPQAQQTYSNTPAPQFTHTSQPISQTYIPADGFGNNDLPF